MYKQAFSELDRYRAHFDKLLAYCLEYPTSGLPGRYLNLSNVSQKLAGHIMDVLEARLPGESLHEVAKSIARFCTDKSKATLYLSAQIDVLREGDRCRGGEDRSAHAMDLIAFSREKLGNQNPITANALHYTANILYHQEKYDEALILYDEAYQIRKQCFSFYHADTAYSLSNMGSVHSVRRRHMEAISTFTEALTIRKAVFGKEDHPDLAKSYHNIGKNTVTFTLSSMILNKH